MRIFDIDADVFEQDCNDGKHEMNRTRPDVLQFYTIHANPYITPYIIPIFTIFTVLLVSESKTQLWDIQIHISVGG